MERRYTVAFVLPDVPNLQVRDAHQARNRRCI